MKSCCLCSELLLQPPDKVWNKPLFESRNFVVLPSLGALIEGWLLLVPKQHFICIGEIPDALAAEMNEIKQTLCAALKRVYGQVCAFEHGPSKANLKIGCGIDHAHLHIVPIDFDLVPAVMQFLPKDTIWTEAGLEECRAAFYRGKDYLYLEQPIGAGRIATHEGFDSQLFRRAIAMRIGALNQFDWHKYPQLQNVSSTIDKVQTLSGSMFHT